MKKLLLLLSLLLATNAWGEEDEFPMKLTCEGGTNILYVYVAEDIYKSWFQFHPSSACGGSGYIFGTGCWVDKYGTEKIYVTGPKKMRKKQASSVDKNTIKLRRIHFKNRWNINFVLNRTTLGSNWGQCFKGFKEYK